MVLRIYLLFGIHFLLLTLTKAQYVLLMPFQQQQQLQQQQQQPQQQAASIQEVN